MRSTIPILLIIVILASSCSTSSGASAAPAPLTPTSTQNTPTVPRATSTTTPAPASPPPLVWISGVLPESLRASVTIPAGIKQTSRESEAGYFVERVDADVKYLETVQWVYTLAAPFPTVTDEVSLAEFKRAWSGKGTGALAGRQVLVDPAAMGLLEDQWGRAGDQFIPDNDLSEILEGDWPVDTTGKYIWALVPFEMLKPQWKVIRIANVSPLDEAERLDGYPLAFTFGLRSSTGDNFPINILPKSNRDVSKMSDVVLTGTTALVRHTALRMEEEGVLYPGQEVATWLQQADLAHVSNEVPFYSACPPANPLRLEARFCSNPRYLDLFTFLGIDLVELTGNHVMDWGPEAMLESLDHYADAGLSYYGGGRNLEEALQPFLWEHHGNRIAFVGCNSMGPQNVLATGSLPGAAPCPFEQLEAEIADLHKQGYTVVFTFQDFEMEDFRPHSSQRHNFQWAAEAGADIVSGSQAHQPQTFAFQNGVFIHYGLGNLFFDQMTDWNRPAFLDRHIFYNGRHISTELLTVVLEDFAQPRPSTPAERADLLTKAFAAAGWLEP